MIQVFKGKPQGIGSTSEARLDSVSSYSVSSYSTVEIGNTKS